MTWKELRELRVGSEPVVHVFVHGLSAVATPDKYDDLVARILAARPAGRVYLMYWESGSSLAPAVFGHYEDQAAKVGKYLLRKLNSLSVPRSWPVHLVGHSLGARVIHYALFHHRSGDRPIDDVVLMAGAADRRDEDWPECIEKVRGRVTNISSFVDMPLALASLRGLRGRIGSAGMTFTHPKLVERRIVGLHTLYWPYLEEVLTQNWEGFTQYDEAEDGFEVECPFCQTRRSGVKPGEHTCDTDESGCGLRFAVSSRGKVKQLPGEIGCPTHRCRFVWEFTRFDPQTTRICPDCDEVLWEQGVTCVR